MKTKFFFLLLVFFSSTVFAQNLVLNPGFESMITCPGFGQFSSSYVASWDKPSIASTDYYNFNCPGIQPTVQSPHSGESYSGIIVYNYGGTEYREYLTGTFSSPLTAGTLYEVGFYVSLNDGYIQAIEEVGAYISTSAPGYFFNTLHINVTPQVENNSGPLDDTATWKYVHGQYLAAGGEMFITIGNFHDDAGTTITQPGTVGSYGTYYFIDDVSVVVDSVSSITSIKATETPQVYYYQGVIEIIQPSNGSWSNGITATVYDVTGKAVTSKLNVDDKILLSENRKSIYLVLLENADGEKCIRKVFVN